MHACPYGLILWPCSMLKVFPPTTTTLQLAWRSGMPALHSATARVPLWWVVRLLHHTLQLQPLHRVPPVR